MTLIVREELKRLQLEAETGVGGRLAASSGGGAEPPLEATPPPAQSNRVFWVTFSLVMLIAVYRIWSMGLITALWQGDAPRAGHDEEALVGVVGEEDSDLW
mmetsp:Transcript_20717/g.66527  ORF Transcript_20717/g.66527 Transcript_20717/m.66527 type:complete len:101 (+) Transcript_20717:2-304(+)